MLDATNKLAVVTGASTGIGLELAKIAAKKKYDLVIAANEPEIEQAAAELRREGGRVDVVQADLSTTEGNDQVIAKIGSRPVALLLANVGRGLGKAFLDQSWDDIRFVIDTNVTGPVYLVRKVAAGMRTQGEGKILFTGSIAGFMPGSYHAVYNATKAFIDSFSYALREELTETRITVTCLMPGPTETKFFERAGLLDTKVGTQEKDDAADVAQTGWDAMMDNEGGVVAGMKNKMQAAMAHVTPAEMLARQHTKMTKPGTAKPN